MKIEDAVVAATAGVEPLLSCLGLPVMAYHVTAIMREPNAEHADEMRHIFMRRSIEALVNDGLEDGDAEKCASMVHSRVGLTWRRLHVGDGTPH